MSCIYTSSVFAKDLMNQSGKVVFLRLQADGGYGPSSDFIDGELVIKLDSQPKMAFGMKLRNNNEIAIREGMLLLLKEAYKNNWDVNIDYWIDPGKNNGEIYRLWVYK